MTFQLAACAEMLWRDRPMEWRASRLKEMDFGVGLWNWPAWDLAALEKTGATFTIMNGYLQGHLTDAAGCEMLRASARETAKVGKRLGVHRLNLHGTGLGDMGIPIPHIGAFAPGMEQRARDTLHRICDLAEAEGQFFTLENLNPIDHPGCPFGSTAAVLGLVSAVNRPQLRINLDLYHTQIGEGDLIRWCQACLPWIGGVQVADNPGRFEPGTGEINYAGVAIALKEMGYSQLLGVNSDIGPRKPANSRRQCDPKDTALAGQAAVVDAARLWVHALPHLCAAGKGTDGDPSARPVCPKCRDLQVPAT